jgi:UDP-galactose transporter B1
MIPVMLMRIPVNGVRVDAVELISGAVAVVGLYVFQTDGMEAGGGGRGKASTAFGLFLLLLSLLLDGYTSPAQERIFSRDPALTPVAVMFNLNLYASVVLGVYIVAMERWADGFRFLANDTNAAKLFNRSAVFIACGQLAILSMVKSADSMATVIVTTTRKFLALLASVLYYGHVLTLLQWAAVGCSIIAVLIHSMYRVRIRAMPRHSQKTE